MSDYEVMMDGGKPWGIRLQGGRNYETPLRIAQVTPGSKASLKGLLVGTHILEIDGNKTDNLTMIQAQNLIKLCADTLTLRLKHDIEGTSVKHIIMEGGKPWGIRLQGGKDSGMPLKIAQVTPGSKASEIGLLVGDEIISINEENTEKLTMMCAQELIKKAGEKLKLGIKADEGVSHGTERREESAPQQNKTNGEDDESFFDDLKESMGGGGENWSSHNAKGNTFNSLQQHTDAGQGAKVRTVFDVAVGDRNKCIPTLAPKLVKRNAGDDSNPNRGREIVMVGGKPWGIRLQGGANSDSPLNIAQVTPGSKASQSGLIVGDEIISINDHDANDLTMFIAQTLIKNTGDKLKLCIKEVEEEDGDIDESFFDDLKISMKGCKTDRSGRDVKGNAFKMLQDVVDSGTI